MFNEKQPTDHINLNGKSEDNSKSTTTSTLKRSQSYFGADFNRGDTGTVDSSKSSAESNSRNYNQGSFYERDDDKSHSHAYFYIGPISADKQSKQLLEDRTSSTTIKLDTDQYDDSFSDTVRSIFQSFEKMYYQSKEMAQQLMSIFY